MGKHTKSEHRRARGTTVSTSAPPNVSIKVWTRVLSIDGEPLADTIDQTYLHLLQKQLDIHSQYADLVHELFEIDERLRDDELC